MSYSYGPTHGDSAGQTATEAIHLQADTVASSADLSRFLEALSQHFAAHAGTEWENASVDTYLEAISAWVAAWQKSDGPAGLMAPEAPWSMVAKIFLAGMDYE